VSGVAVLYSGGMDSVALARLYRDARLVYVRIGSPYEPRELERISGHRVEVIDCGDWLSHHADSMGRVPMRNLLFAVAAAAHTGADFVALGATAGETSPDKSRAFAAAAGKAMSQAENRPVRLLMPFRGITKRQLVRRLLSDGMTAEQLRACPSCYAETLPDHVAGCGRCMSCVRRWVAMSLNDIHERYQSPPWQYQGLSAPKSEMLRFLLRTPVRDWLGVAQVNADLLAALRRVRPSGHAFLS
jgi:7-cyano-7-deazaguanine synthase in queuosine biosynthesis